MQGSLTETYGYDGDGGRVTETVGGVTTLFLEGLWEETRDAGGRVEQRLVFGGQLVATQVVTQSPATTRVEYAYLDHLGSVSTGQGGQQTGQDYEPWGQRGSSAALQSRLRFTGQRLDATGLLYYNARFYDPAIGRFMSADTIVPGAGALTTWPSDGLAAGAWAAGGGGPGNPQNLNRYSYAGNNPTTFNDPSGHCLGPLVILCGAAALKVLKLAGGAALLGGTVSGGIYAVSTPQDQWNGRDAAGEFASGAAGGALAIVGGPAVGSAAALFRFGPRLTKVVRGAEPFASALIAESVGEGINQEPFDPLTFAGTVLLDGTLGVALALRVLPGYEGSDDTLQAFLQTIGGPGAPPRVTFANAQMRVYYAQLQRAASDRQTARLIGAVGAIVAGGTSLVGAVYEATRSQPAQRVGGPTGVR